jgi:hypothetical protein
MRPTNIRHASHARIAWAALVPRALAARGIPADIALLRAGASAFS